MRFSRAIFFATALFTAQPGLANDNIPPKVETTSPGGVNLPDGSFRYQVTDMSIGPLALERFVLSPSPVPTDYTFNGANMTNNFDIFVAPNSIKPVPAPYNMPKEYHPIVHLGAGASGMYLQSNPPGSTASTLGALNFDGNAGNLSWSGTAYTYSDRDGVVYAFNASVPAMAGSTPSQRVSTITYPDGHVRTFTYDANNHLKMVSDSSGYAIIFDWTGSGTADAISAACGFDLSQNYVTATSTCSGATLKVSYGYTSGVLTSFTDILGQVTTYTWQAVPNGGNLITCIKPPGYSSCKVQNFQDGAGYGAIYQQIMADGTVWTSGTDAAFVLNDPEVMPTGCSVSAGYGDPNGKSFGGAFEKSSPCYLTDANGHTTTYTWTGGTIQEIWAPPSINEGTMLANATMPEGDQYLAEYSASAFNSVTKQTWKAKPGSGLPDRVVLSSYALQCAPQYCAKIGTTTDPKGNVTNYDYYSWGGAKSEMEPAPTAGAARPLKLNSYVQKYPYIKNSGGSLVAGPNQIWVPDTETLCQTIAGSSTPTCDSGAPITVTTYEYGANGTADNLLVRGKVVTSGGVSLRTCFGYDAQGNKIWETSPRGTTSAVCS
jgi:hypothetical protein